MKKIFFALAIIVSITACTKSETPNPEPESYVGYLRSEHPNIKISGVSVNDKIIYDLKSAVSISGSAVYGAITSLYSSKFTYLDIVNLDIPPIAEIYATPDESYFYIHISKEMLDYDEIKYEVCDGELFYKTDNIQSIKIKDAEVILDEEDLKTDICKFDIEVTLPNKIIEIVYYGESYHRQVGPLDI